MNVGWLVNTVVGNLLMPPLSLILLCGLGVALRRRIPRLGLALAVGSLLMLTILSTRVGVTLFAAPLERMHAPLVLPYQDDAQAIVVLGGGRQSNAPEYGGSDLPSAATLQRMQHAAILHRQTGLPLLMTGGAPEGATESEAAIMARFLHDAFGVDVRWQEGASNNTAENARLTAEMLRAQGISRILLVTDALHMTRSMRIFSQTGLQVTAAPTAFVSTSPTLATDYVPQARWLQRSAYAIHEWIGIFWYALRH